MTSKSVYSKKHITRALIKLLQTTPIEQISISKLVEEANVSRSAFYNNFKGIEDVLKEIYYQAWQDAYGEQFQDLTYCFSDDYIKDTIRFFDQHTYLLLALSKWHLLPLIARERTQMHLDYNKQYPYEVINQHSYYFMVYSSNAFDICLAWIINNKPESAEELFNIIKSFQTIENELRHKEVNK